MSGKSWSIATLQAAHHRIALDANVLIYVLEGIVPSGLAARALLDAIEAKTIEGCLATVGHVEIMAGPARQGDHDLYERTIAELRSLGLRVVPLTQQIAEQAAWLRGQSGAGLADAVHLASARAIGATAFVTNDRRIPSIPKLEIVYLDDLAES